MSRRVWRKCFSEGEGQLLEAKFLRARKLNVIVFASGVPFHGDVGPCYGFIRSSFSYCRAQEKEVKDVNVTKWRTADSVVQRFRALQPGPSCLKAD